MSATERVLSEFIDAWNAGRRPRANEYLARVEPGPRRDELAGQIASWLELAPAPELDDAARAAIGSDPIVERILAGAGAPAGMWPDVLPRLRDRAGLSLRELAQRVLVRCGLDESEAGRAAGYLERMEHGELAPERVSRRLLEALGEVLGVSGSSIAEAARLGGGLRPASGGALLRSDGDADDQLLRDLEELSRAALTPARPDELDRLFIGGPDA
jgi:transcriptional regulator with XRE-family HTH domain